MTYTYTCILYTPVFCLKLHLPLFTQQKKQNKKQVHYITPFRQKNSGSSSWLVMLLRSGGCLVGTGLLLDRSTDVFGAPTFPSLLNLKLEA